MINSAARQGHVEATVVLGRADKDAGKFLEAVNKFKMAASKGSAEGNNELGMCYYGRKDGSGIGVEQSFADALECYSAGAARGCAASWCNLGMMYERGEGVMERDIGKSERVVRRLAI